MKRLMRYLAAGMAGAAAVLAPVMAHPAVAAAAPPAGASVSGKVTDATKAAPVSGAELRLIGYRASAQASTATAKTAADGSYSFTGLRAGGGWSYQLQIDYLSVRYQSDLLTLKSGENRSVDLKVYQTTTSPAAITSDSWVVWIDVQGGVTAVEQDVVLTNSSTSTYIGGANPGTGAGVALTLPLTPDAGNFQYLGFLSDATGQRGAATFVSSAPIPPGPSQAALRFETHALTGLTFPIAFATSRLTLMVPNGVSVTGARLAPDGQTKDRGNTYRVYSVTGLKPGDSIQVAVTAGAGSGKSPWNPALIAGIAAAVLLIAGGALYYRRRGGPSEAAADGPGAVESAVPAKAVPAKAVPAKAGVGQDGDVEEILDHLALLDLAHERGLLPDEAEYGRRREALTKRLVDLWGEQKR